MFGGVDKKIKSHDFRGGQVTSMFGGSTIDLTEARMASADVAIEVFTMFGGNTFIIPPDYSVDLKVITIFGGYDDKRKVQEEIISDPRRKITIKGIVLFGGGDIKSKQ